jgi:prepilin-type N-terminal cleavage/methylation domain-containing protein
MNLQTSMRRSQSGFTLVEIAIVLVIIGLLLGGVLKGAELIDNAKVRKATGELNGVIAAFYSYQDRYARTPGDDGNLAALTGRGGSWPLVTLFGNTDGALTGTAAQTFNGGNEPVAFWQHLRAGGFIGGDVVAIGVAARPNNAFGGLIGVTAAAVMGGLTGVKVCSSQVPGKAALAMDTQTDDGSPDTGRLRATLGVAGTATVPGAVAAAYSEDNEYTLCQRI